MKLIKDFDKGNMTSKYIQSCLSRQNYLLIVLQLRDLRLYLSIPVLMEKAHIHETQDTAKAQVDKFVERHSFM